MQLNVLKPQKNLKARREAKIYFEAYSDYDICKKWFNKIKFLMKYVEKDICINQILQDIKGLPLNDEGIKRVYDMLNQDLFDNAFNSG